MGALLVAMCAALAAAAGGAGGGVAIAQQDEGDPIAIAVTVAATAPAGVPLPIAFTVTAVPDALDGAGPLRLRAKLATTCGALYASTDGVSVMDAPFVPVAGPDGLLVASSGGTATPAAAGTLVVCAFLEQEGDDRLYAASTETEVTVTAAAPRTLGLTCALTRPAVQRVTARCAATGTARDATGIVLMTLSRGGRVVATSGALLTGGRVAVPFRPGRRLPAGRYAMRALVITDSAGFLVRRTLPLTG